MSKADYVAVNRIETREKTGQKEKKVIKPGTKMSLTAAEAKKLGPAVQKVVVEEPENFDEDDDTGGEGKGNEGGNA